MERAHLHALRQSHGARLASCCRVFEPAGNDPRDEVWRLTIESEGELLDHRALVALPLVCHLITHPKRHVDPECVVGLVLLFAVPPVGALVLGVELAIDGLHLLHRRHD
jgi:hypothetical protein